MSTHPNPNVYRSFGIERWNTCIEILCRDLSELNPVQRAAALVFHYYGRVMNGGHSSHFDHEPDSSDEELIEALKQVGASRHARILQGAIFLRGETKRASEKARDDQENYVWESIEDLDFEFGRFKPDIPELLARYFESHPESFPTRRP